MAKVPVYDAPQVNAASPQPVMNQAQGPANPIGKSTADLGEGLMALGASGASIAERANYIANKARLNEAVAEGTQGNIELKLNMYQLEGKNALATSEDGKSMLDYHIELYDKGMSKIRDGLSNDYQKAAFTEHMNTQRETLRGELGAHVLRQQEVYLDATDKSGIQAAVDSASTFSGDADRQKAEMKVGIDILQERGARKGWDAKMLDHETKAAMSPVYAATVRTMIQSGNAMGAAKYASDNADNMTLGIRESINNLVQPAIVYERAAVGFNKIWQEMGPTDLNAPVRVFDMDAQIDNDFKGDRDGAAHAKLQLREKASMFNSQQKEVNAGNVNGLYGHLEDGMSIAMVSKTREFMALPSDVRTKIMDEWLAHKDAKLGHQLSIVRDTEQLNLYGNEDKYITINDPLALTQFKSRAQIEAMRPMFGKDATLRLADKWDELQKPGAIRDAQYDQDSFNSLADRFGLKPYDTHLSEAKKRELGMLKVNVENKIEIEQQRLKRQLSRTEKDALMESELSKPKVTVDPGMFSRNVEKSPIQMGADDIAHSKPSAEQRASLFSAMQEMHKQFPNKPEYMANEENMIAQFRKSLTTK
jgi:hypothetical protein